MNAEHRPGAPDENLQSEILKSAARRRLVRGAAGSAGVLLSVHAKTALGTTCISPSAQISNNTSPRASTGVTCHGGNSPHHWKLPTNCSSWPSACSRPTFPSNVVVDTTQPWNCRALQSSDVTNQGATMSSMGLTGVSISIWAALNFSDGSPGQELRRQICAAVLNAHAFQSIGNRYPLTPTQVIEMWDAVKGGGTYCPSSLFGSCGSKSWGADKVVNFLASLHGTGSSTQNLYWKRW